MTDLLDMLSLSTAQNQQESHATDALEATVATPEVISKGQSLDVEPGDSERQHRHHHRSRSTRTPGSGSEAQTRSSNSEHPRRRRSQQTAAGVAARVAQKATEVGGAQLRKKDTAAVRSYTKAFTVENGRCATPTKPLLPHLEAQRPHSV